MRPGGQGGGNIKCTKRGRQGPQFRKKGVVFSLDKVVILCRFNFTLYQQINFWSDFVLRY